LISDDQQRDSIWRFNRSRARPTPMDTPAHIVTSVDLRFANFAAALA
jgi:hypothetical protein